jgi:Trk K+ transport system NAD-binding subunit
LNTHLSLEIAVAVIGLGLGLLSPAASTALVVFSMLTVLIMPVLFNLILPVTPEPDRGWMVLFGAEDLGIQVAKVLHQHGELVRFLEPETRLVDQARSAGFEAIHATTISECLDAATRDGIQALLVLSSEDTRNLLVCHAAKRKGLQNTIALVNDPSRLPEYRALDVRPFEPTIYRPPLFALMARSPDIFNLLTTTTDEQDVREVSVLNPLAVNQALRTLELPGNLLVLALNRGGELIIPHGNTRVERGDRLTILGNTTELHDAINWLECPVQTVI